jgi:hypothetical protein
VVVLSDQGFHAGVTASWRRLVGMTGKPAC